MRDDERVHLSGVSLPESNMSAGAVAEGYVSSRDVDPLVDDHLLSPAARSRANVVLHVVPSEAERVAIAALDDLACSPLALAAGRPQNSKSLSATEMAADWARTNGACPSR